MTSGHQLSNPVQSHDEFNRARRQAIVQVLLAKLRGETVDLLPFNDVRQKLRLISRAYRGVQDVPLDRIVGSLDRYQDFTRTFLPRRKHVRKRWAMVDHLTTGIGLAPVELYKVGDCYFVSDGHHRISVARRNDTPTIEAHVYEYQTRVPLEPETTIDGLLLKQEYLEFLEHTGLDKSRPEQRIEFTTHGGYRDLECQIALYQAALSKIDERPFSYEEAATYWYDMIYTSVIQIIQQRGVLEHFADRTEADLFVWTVRHHQELSEEYHHTVPMTKATDAVVEHHTGRWPRRFLQALKERLSR
jgi:hypothetical protein